MKAIKQQLDQENDELAAVTEVTNIVFPVIDGLAKKDIINPITLKVKLAKLDPKYRDAVYGLCRIATEGGPEGSFIVLDPEKVLSLIEEIEVEEAYSSKKKSKKKFIIGITKKVVDSIKGLIVSRLAALCYLVNDLVVKKIINTPAEDSVSQVKAAPLASKKKSRSK